ncbi:hypothetical protein PVAND_004662 [Polypedilum vanderplanki]|uniref:Uncharacterized protein n=1 Tax=Polypedilum vanderplanki TaxID=319348 RepID=A0A9J6BZR9_POLVA|nr:hypothetical protein PVAND_004662 [Polypedilum vanderplanki]
MKIFVLILIFLNNFLKISADSNDEVVCILGTKSLNNCVKTVMTKRLANLHNPKKPEIYDTIDPFLFDHAKLSFNESDKFHGSFSIKNVLIEGGSKINFKRIAIKRHKMMMKILGVIHIPEINVDGLFKSNLRIDTYLFKSDGNFNGTIEDLHGKFVVSGKFFETDDGLLQFKVENFHIFFIIIDMNIHLYGKQIDDNLSLIIDRIINESWQYVYQDLIARSRFIFGKVLQLKCLVL